MWVDANVNRKARQLKAAVSLVPGYATTSFIVAESEWITPDREVLESAERFVHAHPKSFQTSWGAVKW